VISIDIIPVLSNSAYCTIIQSLNFVILLNDERSKNMGAYSSLHFCERLNALIKEKGVRKIDFFEELGLSKNSISNWLDRNTIPSGDVLAQIADYFNVSVDYLLGRTNSKNPPTDTVEGFGFKIDDSLKDEVKELINIYISLDRAGRSIVFAKAVEEQRIKSDSTVKQTTGIA